ncbi:MAG: phage integrase SAM-like domain-containing protein [Planctomycetales bacterium]|nr:phage integrase SAM-like domain-containing protein [Planctomycetales bacterium]
MKGEMLIDYFETVYRPQKLAGKSASYIQCFERSLERFCMFHRGDIAIDKVTDEKLNEYRDWHLRSSRGTTATSRDDVLRIKRILAASRHHLRKPKKRTASKKRPESPTGLRDFFETVYVQERRLGRKTAAQFRWALDDFERWHKRPVRFEDLDSALSPYVEHLEERELSPATIKSRRAYFITLWRYAFAIGAVDEKPETLRIRQVALANRLPDAWTFEQMQTLLRACRTCAGGDSHYPSGIRRSYFWEALARFIYDTGVRRGDALATRFDQLGQNDDGYFVRLVQRKTRQGLLAPLSKGAWEAIERIREPKRELIFEWTQSEHCFHNHWRAIVTEAGLPVGQREGMQKIRRTSASHLEAVHPGAATRHLGHKTPDMARKHYIDPTISEGPRPLPPELE